MRSVGDRRGLPRRRPLPRRRRASSTRSAKTSTGSWGARPTTAPKTRTRRRTLVTLPGATGPVDPGRRGQLTTASRSPRPASCTRSAKLLRAAGEHDQQRHQQPNPTPTLVTLPGATGPVTQIAAGDQTASRSPRPASCTRSAATTTGSWGARPTTSPNNPNPTPTLVTLPGATGPVTQIAAGGDHSLAVTSTGQLYAFGDNSYGQLGSATNNEHRKPEPDAHARDAAGGHAARDPDRRGRRPQPRGHLDRPAVRVRLQLLGQLGSATNSGTYNPNPTPTLVSLPGATGPVTQVAAGFVHSLAVTSTGQLYAFGHNDYGQLGSTTNNGTENPNPTPTLVTLPGATRPGHPDRRRRFDSLAVTSTGQLYAFGENYSGSWGARPTTAPQNQTPRRRSWRWGRARRWMRSHVDRRRLTRLCSPRAPSSHRRSRPRKPRPSGRRSARPASQTGASALARQATAISAKRRPLGTSFLGFTLSAAAKLKIAITRSAPGLRHGRSCLAPSAKLNGRTPNIALARSPSPPSPAPWSRRAPTAFPSAGASAAARSAPAATERSSARATPLEAPSP